MLYPEDLLKISFDCLFCLCHFPILDSILILILYYQHFYIGVWLKKEFCLCAPQVSGPVAIVAAGADIARTDAAGLFQFCAIVNLNVRSALHAACSSGLSGSCGVPRASSVWIINQLL